MTLHDKIRTALGAGDSDWDEETGDGPANPTYLDTLAGAVAQALTGQQSFFVAEDADGEIILWSGQPGDANCQPMAAQTDMDRHDEALWPALLLGLGVSEDGAT